MTKKDEEQPAATVRRLMGAAQQGVLASALARDDSGRPYASLVLVALDADNSPLLLLSDLSDHSRNVQRDSRAAVLFDGTAGYADPLSGPRATVLGRLDPVARGQAESAAKARFLARHPRAALYADFADFRVYRMAVDSAHLVAGFGRIHWLSAADIGCPPAEPNKATKP